MAFDATLQKDYVEAAQHFIKTQQTSLSWANVKLMLENKREELVKECIKSNVRFDHSDAQTRRMNFHGRASMGQEDRTIRLIDFLHIMLELKWKTPKIKEILKNYSKKGKLKPEDLREMFLLFAIKRKIKLMSHLVNSDDFNFSVDQINFMDILENGAYDMGVLVYREYFLQINSKIDKIVNLLIMSFTESNGMLEAKAFLLKRFIKDMSYEQAVAFLTAVEQSVRSKSRSNILILTLNVIKSSCLLIELIERVRSQFGFLDRRIEEIRQQILKIAKEYIERVDNEEEMAYLLLEKDIDFRDSLNMIYDYSIIELLQNPYAQKIVRNIWDSKFNVNSTIFAASSAHQLVFNYDHCRYDLEKRLRFTNRSKNLSLFGTHGF